MKMTYWYVHQNLSQVSSIASGANMEAGQLCIALRAVSHIPKRKRTLIDSDLVCPSPSYHHLVAKCYRHILYTKKWLVPSLRHERRRPALTRSKFDHTCRRKEKMKHVNKGPTGLVRRSMQANGRFALENMIFFRQIIFRHSAILRKTEIDSEYSLLLCGRRASI